MKNISEVVGISVLVLSCLAVNQATDLFGLHHVDRNAWTIGSTIGSTFESTTRPDRVRFGINWTNGNSNSTWTNDMPWSSFQGLDAQQLSRLNGEHTFKFVRDAGTLVCTGVIANGRGRGDYSFQENPAYLTELQKLGFLSPTSDDLFQMAMNDVSLAFVRGVKSVGLEASTSDLLDLRNHGLSADFIREAKNSGSQSLTVRDLIQLKDHGVQSDFLRGLKDSGYAVPVNEIIAMRDHGVDVGYLKELARYGLNPDAEDLPKLKYHGVSPEFLRALDDGGFGDLEVNEIVEMRDHGVDPKFLKEAKTLGYTFSSRDIIQMRDHGVDGAYLRKLKDTGFQTLSAEKIIKLRTHGGD